MKSIDISETDKINEDILEISHAEIDIEDGIVSRDLFDAIGSFGPFQKRIVALFFAINIVCVWQNFAVTFLAPNMDFRCSSAHNNNTDTFSNGADQCHVAQWQNDSIGISEIPPEDRRIPCNRWEYNLTTYQKTIVNEWDLVCDREWLISLSESLYMVGFMASDIFFGHFSDSFGRYPTLVICYVISLVSSLLSIFSQNYLMFAILRFFLAFGRNGTSSNFYVLIMETIGPDKRDSIGIAMQTSWSIGIMILPALSWFIRSWVWLEVAMAVPLLPLMCMICLVPESLKWLKARGKMAKFKKVIVRARKENNRNSALDISHLSGFNSSEYDHKDGKTIMDLLRKPLLRNRLLCICYLWFVMSFVYFDIAFNTNDLAGNPYLNFFLSASTEIPSCLLTYFVIRAIGHRLPLIFAMFVTGASYIAIMTVPPDIHWLAVAFSIVGRFFVNGAFTIIYLNTTELFPTVVRNIAFSTSSMWGCIGSILAPFNRELGMHTHRSVPNIVNVLLAISSGIVAILLPETKGIEVPDTLDEIEDTNGKIYNFRDMRFTKVVS